MGFGLIEFVKPDIEVVLHLGGALGVLQSDLFHKSIKVLVQSLYLAFGRSGPWAGSQFLDPQLSADLSHVATYVLAAIVGKHPVRQPVTLDGVSETVQHIPGILLFVHSASRD